MYAHCGICDVHILCFCSLRPALFLLFSLFFCLVFAPWAMHKRAFVCKTISIPYTYVHISSALSLTRKQWQKLVYSQVCAHTHTHTHTFRKTVKTNKLVIGIMVIQLISFRVCVWLKGMRIVKTFVRLHILTLCERASDREWTTEKDWNACYVLYRQNTHTHIYTWYRVAKLL